MYRCWVVVSALILALAFFDSTADAGKKKKAGPDKYDGKIVEVKTNSDMKVVSLVLQIAVANKKDSSKQAIKLTDKTKVSYTKIPDREDREIKVGYAATVHLQTGTTDTADSILIRPGDEPPPKNQE